MKFGFYTLGCKVNQYETQAMEQLLAAKGHEICDFHGPCDAYIINTCSVTAVADKKNRAVIRRCRRENPHAVIAVCGCYPQHAAEALENLGIDVLGGSAEREQFLQQVLDTLQTRQKAKVLDQALKRRSFEILPAGGLEGRTRAMLKVQDGCVNFCSYCIIPYTRGPVRSAPIDLAVEQARVLAEQGYKEIVVTGIEIASWGVDLPGKPLLTALLEAVCTAVPDLRVRLGSLEPRIVTETFCESLRKLPNICPVQDGCVNFCSYCIIPYTRGPVRSAPIDLAVEQARVLAEQGYKEIVVTGIEIASWGVDLPGKPLLTALLEAVCTAVPDLRVRLGSLEPRIVTETFCESLRKLPNICPQFHLSMQSGCDTVLARMKRKYDTARYLQSVQLLNRYFPGCAVTTDMIVAFPGETEEEFAASLEFIQKCAFADMHIFPYSRRPGTPADKMPGQLNNAVKEARSKAAIAVAEEMSRTYRQSLVNTRVQVLFEEKDGTYYTGHTPNYIKVYVPGEDLHNVILPVTVTGLHNDGVMGRLDNRV